MYCWEDWTEMCQAVDDYWYGHDYEYLTPDRPAEDCAYNPDVMEFWNEYDQCLDQWETLSAQCYGYYESDAPYWWSEDCDMMESFWDFWSAWNQDWEWNMVMRKHLGKTPEVARIRHSSVSLASKRVGASTAATPDPVT